MHMPGYSPGYTNDGMALRLRRGLSRRAPCARNVNRASEELRVPRHPHTGRHHQCGLRRVGPSNTSQPRDQ